MLVSESMYILDDRDHVAVRVPSVGVARRGPTRPGSVALIGLSALTRPEAVILVPLFGIPFLFARNLAWPSAGSAPCW